MAVHVNRGVTCVPEPVVARGSSGAELFYLLAGGSRVAGGASRKTEMLELGHDGGEELFKCARNVHIQLVGLPFWY